MGGTLSLRSRATVSSGSDCVAKSKHQDSIDDGKLTSPLRWFGPLDGNNNITAADFDALMGHSCAVTDAAGSVFAAELIAAYPEAKVVLNYRRDIDAWHHSAINTLVRNNTNWVIFALSRLSRQLFWSWHVYVRFMWPGLFRALDGNIETGISRNGKWVYRGMWCPL